MNRVAFVLCAIVALAGVIPGGAPASQAAGSAASIFPLPAGYRQWQLISVAHEEGKLNDLRAILGNDIAIAAARRGDREYPDGAIVARVAWNYVPLAESARAFGQVQSFVAGAPKNGVQFMVKDAKKFAATGGWGYAQFDDGKPAGGETANTCFACHSIVKARDFVFSRYAP